MNFTRMFDTNWRIIFTNNKCYEKVEVKKKNKKGLVNSPLVMVRTGNKNNKKKKKEKKGNRKREVKELY